MAKIESVVTDCTDCRYSKQYVEDCGNTSFVLICNYHEQTENNRQIYSPTDSKILLYSSSSKIKGGYSSVNIPKECPLEDYKPNIEL